MRQGEQSTSLVDCRAARRLLQQFLSRAESLGGRTVVAPTPIPGVGSFAMFSDLEENQIGLSKGQ